ncbi:ArsR/SmtB family transcription factor [Deinococcus frigens]|uniref:ArsR/SmtB family transcription factor n=1 Tax=Deinococcus frigens TaxID=249403 RepID=UPI00138E214C|nr:helix-turn-helix domain-containing protein [Deinococcus frigens]
MKGPDSGRAHVIQDVGQAHLLSDPRSLTYFKPFLAEERTVSAAAQELGCNLNTLLYRVRVMLDAGLLRVTRTERRAGRAIKHYRSVHDAYFVPFGLTAYHTLEDRLAAQGAPLFGTLIRAYGEVLRSSEHSGRFLLRDERGAVLTTDFPPQQTPGGLPIVFYDTTLTLDVADARALGENLQSAFGQGVSARASASSGPAGQRYLLMVALLPLAEVDQVTRPGQDTEA